MSDPREMHCRRTVNDGKDRCPWHGSIDDFAAHTAATAEAGDAHRACLICRQSLADGETQTCTRCVKNVDDDLGELVDLYAVLPDAIERTALHTGQLPGGNALVLLADGSVDGGGPDDDIKYRDPLLILATLHVIWERDWRETFGHDHFPRWQATVTSTVAYLRMWLRTAARTHPAFDDFVSDVRTLHRQLARTVGRSDDPASANADCTRCGGRLRQKYRPPAHTEDERRAGATRILEAVLTRIARQRDAERSYGLAEHQLTQWPGPYLQRELVEPVLRGQDKEGLDDTAVCADCGHEYTSGEYRIALRLRALANASGWLTPTAAASLIDKPVKTVWTWIWRLQVPVACRVEDHRIVVEADAVKSKGRFQSTSTDDRCA